MMTERTQLSAVAMILLAASATASGQGGGARYWLPASGGFGTDRSVAAALAWDQDGPGPARPALYIGGWFTQAGGDPVTYIASWDGRGWSSLGGGMNGPVYALATIPDAGLIAGGTFTSTGGPSPTGQVAAWDGVAWSSLGWSRGTVFDLTAFDPDGDGPQRSLLMARNEQDLIYAWDEVEWFFTDPLVDLARMASWDADGAGPASPILLAGGTTWPGGSSGLIRRWDGQYSPSWSQWGGGLFTGWGVFDTFAQVAAFTTWDADGDGPAQPLLVAAGVFDHAPGASANSIAIWDGGGWSALGAGLTDGSAPGLVAALASFDPDGAGPLSPLLIAGGLFDAAGGVPVNNIAVWDGESWSAMAGGLTHDASGGWGVRTLTTYDPDGPGPRPPWLVAGGDFTFADGRASPHLALWGFCPADLTEDALIDFSDYLEFLNAYEAQDLRVDYTGDGLVDFGDYLEFLNVYAAGC